MTARCWYEEFDPYQRCTKHAGHVGNHSFSAVEPEPTEVAWADRVAQQVKALEATARNFGGFIASCSTESGLSTIVVKVPVRLPKELKELS